ncbi:carbohydrate binding domain-containing protein [Acholeplasma hippikon]|nr:carbohydrate binding domain-containing protein [Acholeplasma hippikon]
MFFAGTYEIEFDLKADDARKIRVALEGAGLSGDEAFKYIDATTEWKTIKLTYTFNTDQMNKALDFFLGSLTTDRNGVKFDAEYDVLTTLYFRNLNVKYTELGS